MARWTEEEEKVLTEVWKNPKVTLKDLPKIFIGRSVDTLKRKADALNLGRKAFTPLGVDYEYLKSLVDVKDI